jgi:hypothetical protein
MNRYCRAFGFAVLLPVFVFGQAQKKSIKWASKTQQANLVKGVDGVLFPSDIKALEIVEIEVENNPISLGESFSASDDWLRYLTIRVKNISGKPISSIRISLSLPETKNEERTFGFSLEYGKALSTGIDYGIQKPIMPNEELELFRNEAHYQRGLQTIAQRSGLTHFSEVLIDSTVVQFEDGTVWLGWRLPLSKQNNLR